MQGPNFTLNGRVAVVTGASRGIGAAIAAALARSGAAVALVGRDPGSLEPVAAALVGEGFSAQAFAADVADAACLEPVFARIEAALGPPDILVNNAGVEQLCA